MACVIAFISLEEGEFTGEITSVMGGGCGKGELQHLPFLGYRPLCYHRIDRCHIIGAHPVWVEIESDGSLRGIEGDPPGSGRDISVGCGSIKTAAAPTGVLRPSRQGVPS